MLCAESLITFLPRTNENLTDSLCIILSSRIAAVRALERLSRASNFVEQLNSFTYDSSMKTVRIVSFFLSISSNSDGSTTSLRPICNVRRTPGTGVKREQASIGRRAQNSPFLFVSSFLEGCSSNFHQSSQIQRHPIQDVLLWLLRSLQLLLD